MWGAAMFDGWVTGHRWRTYGRKIFRPYIRGAAACGGCAITTCGRLRINRARAGEKYFAPTHAARGYIGRVPRMAAVMNANGILIAYARSVIILLGHGLDGFNGKTDHE